MRLAFCTVVLGAAVAHANPAAEKLFQDGREALKQGNLEEACDKLRRSADLEARVGTLLNLGDCEEKRGRIATAWEVFVQARTVAAQKKDPRSGEAEKRAQTLVAKLPQLTIRAPAQRPDGFTVTRDGKPVAAAELDHEVPIDPGRYQIEAAAPNHETWKQSTPVAVGQKVIVEIPALQPSASSATATTNPTTTNLTPTNPANGNTNTSTTVVATPSHDGASRRAGIGIAAGATHEFDPAFTLRMPLQLAAAGKLRLVPVVSYTYQDDYTDDPYHNRHYFGFAIGIEYVSAVSPKLDIAVGICGGLELIDDAYDSDRLLKKGFGTARVSPTYRLGRAVDAALHVELVVDEDDVLGRGVLGVDYYFY